MSIFEPAGISNINLKNRIIRSATHEGLADIKGIPQDGMKEFYLRLAEGGTGAIITGFASVSREGRVSSTQAVLDNDACIEKFAEIIKPVQESGVPVILQLAHGGGQSTERLTGKPAKAPSAYKYQNGQTAQELTDDDIHTILQDFVQAIGRAKTAGFAGVQLHAAHGYLLSQFLSPLLNRRNDNWGGSTENRFRFIREIYTKAREKYANYPILVKLTAYDTENGGMTVEEAVSIAKLLEKSSCDGIEVSCGNMDGFCAVRPASIPIEALMEFHPAYRDLPSEKKKRAASIISSGSIIPQPIENYNLEAAERIKAAVSIPIIAVGGIHRLQSLNDAINNKQADFVSMCRPFIIEPDIVNRMKAGREKSRCIECNYCLMGIMSGPLKCYYGKLPEKHPG